MKDREEKREELVPEFLGKDGFSLRCAHCGIYTHSLCLGEEVVSTSRKGRLYIVYLLHAWPFHHHRSVSHGNSY